MQRWYLVHTKPGREALAQRNLTRQDYEVYFPRLADYVVREGRRRKRVCALFPRYLFVCVAEGTQPLAPICSSKGVSGMVRFGTQFAVVPERVIRELRERADPVSGLHSLSDSTTLAHGAAVRIIAGHFGGLEGVFENHLGAERVIVLLNVLGQSARVHIPTDFIVPAHA